MLRTVQYACSLLKDEADALNRESERISSDILMHHYRLYWKQGVWLAPKSGERLEDALGGAGYQVPILSEALAQVCRASRRAGRGQFPEPALHRRAGACLADSTEVSSSVRGEA